MGGDTRLNSMLRLHIGREHRRQTYGMQKGAMQDLNPRPPLYPIITGGTTRKRYDTTTPTTLTIIKLKHNDI